MSTITGYTAAKMQTIIDETVASGSVNGSGHLILTLHDGNTIDAGYVVGPTGPAGSNGTNGADGNTYSLDQLAGFHPTAADWSNNTHKITSLANGSASSDAAALGQVVKKAGDTLTGAISPAVATLTFGTTIAVDASLGNHFRLTLTASTGTLSNPTNPVDGQRIIVEVLQDATGGRTMAFGTAYEFSTGLPSPTLSTAANTTDLLGFIYNANKGKWFFVAFVNGFA